MENEISINQRINLRLVDEFPELEKAYQGEVKWQEGDKSVSHIVYGDVFAPFIERCIKNSDNNKLTRISNFIEDLLIMDIEYVSNVICLSVLERIIDDKDNFEYFRKFTKEKTNK